MAQALAMPAELMASAFAPEDEGCAVFPENWPALQLFLAMQTQWRCGPAGFVGLDYAVLPFVERRIGVGKALRADVFQALQVIEHELLRLWREQRES